MLLGCPFCGSDATSYQEGDHGYWRTGCVASFTCGHRGSALPTRYESESAWNRRTDLPKGSVADAPLHWRCYHCNYVATTKQQASEHYGEVMNARPAACLAFRRGCKYATTLGARCRKCGEVHVDPVSTADSQGGEKA